MSAQDFRGLEVKTVSEMSAFDLLTRLLAQAPGTLPEGVDWSSVLDLASDNKLVLPLAHAVANQPQVPQRLRDQLTGEATRKSLMEIHRAGRLLEILQEFRNSGIEVKSFKGLTLAQVAHDRVTARECCDIDLLVKPFQFDRALQLLHELGFEYEMEGLPRCYTRFHYGVPLHNKSQNLTIDLHYQLFSAGVHFPTDPIWATAFEVEIQGVRVPTFLPEQTFVYLALHGAKHCWHQLRWLHDLYVLLNKVDLEEVERFALRQQCERSVSLALGLLDRLWQTGVSIKERPDPTLLNQSLGVLRGAPISWPEYHRYQYRCQSTWPQRLKLFLHTWFSPQIHDLRFLDLPPRLWFVYYAIRPIRILGRKLIPSQGASDD